MRRTAFLGLFVMLLALATPGFAQDIKDPAEYESYMKVFNEKDPAKKSAAAEKFLVDYPKTTATTQTYMMIILSYAQSQNWAKALEYADKMPAALSADDKKLVRRIGMAAADGTKNQSKQKEYAGKVLEDNPQDLTALVMLSGLLANSIPTDEAAKMKHLDETLAITKRALAVPRPAGVTDAQWKPVVLQLNDTTCMVLLNQKKNAEAIAACQEAIKLEKKDGYAYYLMGLAMKPAVAEAIDKYKASVDNLNANRTADQLTRDDLKATSDALDSAAQTKVNELIEVFAKSVATGWSGAANARNELKIFKGTPEELEKLIAAKKDELGVGKAD